MKILIAEDDPLFRQLLERTLARLGHEVVVTENGREAWEAFQREQVPLVISDWLMPELDGPELCRRIRAEDRPKYTYIILWKGCSRSVPTARTSGTRARGGCRSSCTSPGARRPRFPTASVPGARNGG